MDCCKERPKPKITWIEREGGADVYASTPE
jgi:hypothetical protein